jgi:hypothetical protein
MRTGRPWAGPHAGNLRRGGSASGLPSGDVEDEECIPEFVGHIHAPVVAGLQSSINILENSACYYSRLSPRGMLIRKLLSLFVDLGPLMMDVEKVPWHFSINERKRICSSGLAGQIGMIRLFSCP